MVEPLLLRDVYGMSYEEIAQQVGAPLGTVKAQIHHGRKLVRPLLAASEGDLCGGPRPPAPSCWPAAPAADDPATASAARPRPAPQARSPAEDGGPALSADDPRLDVALSEPVEDSYYPEVGDPGVDALAYDLALAWGPGSGCSAARRRSRSGRPATPRVPARPGPGARGRRGPARRRGRRATARRQGPRRRTRLWSRTALRAGGGVRRHARAGRRPDDAWRLQHHRLHHHALRRDLDDAGAVRRAHLVPGQRPAVGQGALRLHADRAVPVGRRRQRRAGPDASARGGRRPPGTWPSRRRRTSRRWRSATTR